MIKWRNKTKAKDLWLTLVKFWILLVSKCSLENFSNWNGLTSPPDSVGANRTEYKQKEIESHFILYYLLKFGLRDKREFLDKNPKQFLF